MPKLDFIEPITQKELPLAHKMQLRLFGRNIRTYQVAYAAWLDIIRRQALKDIGNKFQKDITGTLTDWKFLEKEGKRIIKPATAKIMESVGGEAIRSAGLTLSFDVLNAYAAQLAETATAHLVTNVLEETKEAIRIHIADGIEAGKSMDVIGRELRSVVGLNAVQERAASNLASRLETEGFSSSEIATKVAAYERSALRERGLTIARTETATAQDLGFVEGMRQIGIERVVVSVSPDERDPNNPCEDCLALDGESFLIADAEKILPVHPQCRCAWLPDLNSGIPEGAKDDLAYAPSAKDLGSWPNYRALHQGEGKNNTQLLYDFYKQRYERTGFQTEKTTAWLKARAAKFETTAVKVSVEVPGIPVGAVDTAIAPTTLPVVEPLVPTPAGTLTVDKWGTFDSTKVLDDFAAHKAALIERLGFDPASLKGMSPTSAEFKAAAKKLDEVLKSFATHTTSTEAQAAKTLKLLKQNPSVAKKVKEFYGVIDRYGSSKVIEHLNVTNFREIKIVVKGQIRASASEMARSLQVYNSQQAIFHEMGHTLEWGSEFTNTSRKSMKWLYTRSGGQTAKFNEIVEWSKDTQRAFKDKFIDPYVGKFYESGHTEVLSMGMENFVSDVKALRFAIRDFDHFSFVHGVLSGGI